ncbi:MAG: hypothetical protein NT015_05365 [Alphaproteobacteria bacterium]|nr:hypothetical protein [Alphaproteobacteria bacterium]
MPQELHADFTSGAIVAAMSAFSEIGATPEAASRLMFRLGDTMVECCDHHGLDHQREAMFLQGYFQSSNAAQLDTFLLEAAQNMPARWRDSN